MSAGRAQRRLAAILAADVVGYSRLMAADEAGTHGRLKALRKDFIEPTIAEHHGRVVKLMGDGALVEFASVVDAVECAAAIQAGAAARQTELPEHQRIGFRIGVNLGDVIIEGDDIHGDGVNIAARLEALAEPGSILISRTVRDNVQDKLPHGFEDLGEQQVKNIPRPVHVFRVVPDGAKAAGQSRRRRIKARWWWWAAPVVLLLIVAGGAWLWPRLDEGVRPAPREEVAQETPLDRYRIAVLPFTNISADSEDEYFSDGMTEELISKLSRLHDLSVIARTSIMQYKATEKGIAEIGRELQVGTILEGSVRRDGERLRITAQLIDVVSQAHLWSEDYDRDMTDVFAIQSAVAQHVAEALQITLKPSEANQLAKVGTTDLEAYNTYLRGLYHFNKWSKIGLEKSIDYFQKAIARDPGFAKAYSAMAFSYELMVEYGYLPPDEGFPKVMEMAQRALKIDATIAEAYTGLALAAGNYDLDWVRADESYRRALELNPNSALTHDYYGVMYLSAMGRFEEAITHSKRAKELDPLTSYIGPDLGWSYNHARRWDEAIAECQQALELDPNFYFTHWCLGFAYWQKGRLKEAVTAFERGVALNPGDSQLLADLAIVYADAGDKTRAQKILDELEETARREYVSPLALAMAYMASGDLNSTFAWLDKMYEEHHPWLSLMNEHARYDRLRHDPRFQELLRKIGF